MKMHENQESIYNGLKSIGEEISGFYLSGLKLIEDEALPSKAYFIAHSAREIDAGIRDILAPKEEKEKKQKELSLEGELKKVKGHVASSLVALDLPIDDPFASEYIDVVTKFVKHTHRRGAFKSPRESSEIILLWKRYEIILLKLLGNFINQLKQIERILKFDKPTDEILHTIKNIFNDRQKEHYFYNNLKSVNWLVPLYENGFFSPEYLLDNFYWNQSEYLEYISLEIKENRIKHDYSKILIKIIDEVCSYSIEIREINNYRIWYTFITILTNLPKEYVVEKIIDYFPMFFNTKYENVLQSDAIFKFIFSYFENHEYSLIHKSKIDKIIRLVFEISNNEVFKDSSTYENDKINPIIRSYRLKEACNDKFFYSSIAMYCSNDIIFYIADNLLTYLKNDYASHFVIKSIFHLDEIDRSSYSVETIFTLFLKNTCLEIYKISPHRIDEIIIKFLSKRYNHNHFIKLTLFLFAKTWSDTKAIFFELIKNKDERMIFSNNFWGDDLYFFLENISILLRNEEAKIIEKIIENGSQDKDYYNKNKYLDDYRLHWYSALNENPVFQNKYLFFSKKLNKTKEETKPQKRVYVTSGSVSPINKKDIQSIPIGELVRTLRTFDPKRGFRTPSVEGLANNINEVVKENPELFYDNYKEFYKVPYRHISSIFYGLYDAWSAGKCLKWDNILKFMQCYIAQKEFGTNELQLKEATYKYNHLDIINIFSRLMSKGMRNDNKVFSPDLLPLTENIIFTFLENYVSNELKEEDKGKLGSAMHAVNSTTGLIIGVFLDYSLRKARLKGQDINDKTPKWSIKEKEAFESLIEKGVQEFFMYFGWHRGNFYFLDYEWTNNLTKSIPEKNIQTIKSYFGCHLIQYNTYELDYITFKDIYIKAINENWKITDNTMGDNPIEFHTTVFYIFDYEDINEGEIITFLLNQKDIKKISGLIHHLSFKYDEYYEELSSEDKTKFRRKIYKIWERTLIILDESRDVEAKNMPTLFYLIKFVDEFDEENYNLIKRTSNFARQRRDLDELIKNLNRLKQKGDVQQSCIYACEIFVESVFNDFYYASIMQKEIIEFVEFLYQQQSSILKKHSNKICNQFAENGQYFLRGLYEKYN